MATTTEFTLKPFNLEQALNGATIAFSEVRLTDNGYVHTGVISEYVNNFYRVNDSTYLGKVGNTEYKFNSLGGCFDGAIAHQLFIVEAEIVETKGTASSRGDADGGTVTVDINTLQPREHFAIAALRGILFHIENPLNLTGAQITQICGKSFEIANGMMAAAADARAEAEEGGGGSTEEDKKEEVEVVPEELTSNADKILYNIYVQNNNRAVDDKARFDKLVGATYADGKLDSVDGLKIHTTDDKPLITKLHEDSKIAEVVKVTEVVGITDTVDVNITNEVLNTSVSGTADVNIASSAVTLAVEGDVEVTNTVDVSGSVSCSNMLSEPVYVSVRNSPTVTVDNMLTEPVAVTGSVEVSGSVSVSNLSTPEPDNDQQG